MFCCVDGICSRRQARIPPCSDRELYGKSSSCSLPHHITRSHKASHKDRQSLSFLHLGWLQAYRSSSSYANHAQGC